MVSLFARLGSSILHNDHTLCTKWLECDGEISIYIYIYIYNDRCGQHNNIDHALAIAIC